MHSQCMGPFISIGTGKSDLDMFSARSGNFNNALSNLKVATKLPPRTNKAHVKMLGISYNDNKEVFPYYRFDGGERLGRIAMDDWESHRFRWPICRSADPGCKTLDKMDVAAAIYLKDRDVERKLQECARLLVRRRRLRARHTSGWDRYASFSYYECDFPNCQHLRVDKAEEFEEHLRNIHHVRVPEGDMKARVLERRQIYWLYRDGARRR